MLLNAVIICSLVIVNAESPLNSYSISGDNNGYDYNNAIINNGGYLGSKDGYQNGATNFYNSADINHQLSNYISRPLINGGNQGNTGSDTGNIHNGYTLNDQRNEYSGYSNTYENPNSDSYSSSSHTVSNKPFRGSYVSDVNNNGESSFHGYSNDPIHKDSDFGQYTDSTISNSQKASTYSGYSRPTTLENYSGNPIDNPLQGYRGFSDSVSYSNNHHVYSPYSPGTLSTDYPFGKQQDNSSNLKVSKYNDIHPMLSGMRHIRGNPGHMNHNHDISSYLQALGPNSHFSKIYGAGGIYSSGKPNKYGYKYISRYAPNSNANYISRERDGHYTLYGKGGGKIILVKKNRPNYLDNQAYLDETLFAGSNSYKSKNNGFINTDYATSPNFGRYSRSSTNRHDDGSVILRRYKPSSGHIILQKTVYS